MFRRSLLLLLSMFSLLSYANGISNEQVATFEQFCHKGAEYHERRIFDAISASEFINWAKVDVISTDSRLNYTRTLLTETYPEIVECDLVINYFYDDKDVVISTQFRVETQNDLTLSDTEVTRAAVNDFIVRVMVD